MRYLSAFFAMPRGSRGNVSRLLPPLKISHISLAVDVPIQGTVAYVAESGLIIRSDSCISVKPRIEDPSSFGSPSVKSWIRNILESIVVWWNRPKSPVNCKSRNLTLSSLSRRMTCSALNVNGSILPSINL
jgi:hypothetical protein